MPKGSHSGHSSQKQAGSTCAVCEKLIREKTATASGEDAIFCEGACQAWQHRWCAGLTRKAYIELASSEDPFLCCRCVCAQQAKTVRDLLVAVDCLRLELDQLKAKVESPNPSSCATEKQTERENGSSTSANDWQLVESRKRSRPRAAKKARTVETGAQGSEPRNIQQTSHQARAGVTEKQSQRQHWFSVEALTKNNTGGPSVARRQHGSSRDENREVVEGVRRVWGTMKGCSCRTILSTLQRCSSISEKVEVRRKYKKKGENEIRWWFLIRGEEADLQTLEQEWSCIERQTSWRLEHCYQPSPAETLPSNHDENENVSSFLMSQ